MSKRIMVAFVISIVTLVCLSTGCAHKYALTSGHAPVGMHCFYTFTSVHESSDNKGYKMSWTVKETSETAVIASEKERTLGLWLSTVTGNQITTMVRDGKEVDEATRKNLEKQMNETGTEMSCEWVGARGDSVAREAALLPLSMHGYMIARLAVPPAEPKAVGDRWEITAKGDTYSMEGYAELAKVEKRDGRLIATIKGAMKGTYSINDLVNKSTLSWTDSIEDYECEVDLTTHTSGSASYTIHNETVYGDSKETGNIHNTWTLTECKQMNNEEWQPGITKLARAVAGLIYPNEYGPAIKTIKDFIDEHPKSQLTPSVRGILAENGANVGKNFYDMAKFDQNTTWFNTMPLTKDKMKGKVCLVEFFSMEAWGPNMSAFPTEKRIYEEFEPQGLMFLGIATDPPPMTAEKLAVAMKDLGLKFPMYWDATGELSKAFSLPQVASLYGMLLDRDGKIVWEGEVNYDFLHEMITDMLAGQANP